jgi:hypothetical protein
MGQCLVKYKQDQVVAAVVAVCMRMDLGATSPVKVLGLLVARGC